MTEPASDQQWQELLKGAEGPRQLPAALRERLLDELAAPVVAPAPGEPVREPIPAALRGRLEVALGARHRARRRSFAVSLGGIAAVVAGLALLFGGTGGAGRTGQRESLGTDRQSAVPVKGPTGNAGPVFAGRAAATKPSPGPTTPGTGTPARRSAGHSFSAAVRPPSSPRPGVLAMAPRQGPVSGGNAVVLSGARMSAVRAVYFGGAKGTILRRSSPTSMVVRVPAHRAGRALVTFSTTGAVPPWAPVYYRYMGGVSAR